MHLNLCSICIQIGHICRQAESSYTLFKRAIMTKSVYKFQRKRFLKMLTDDGRSTHKKTTTSTTEDRRQVMRKAHWAFLNSGCFRRYISINNMTGVAPRLCKTKVNLWLMHKNNTTMQLMEKKHLSWPLCTPCSSTSLMFFFFFILFCFFSNKTVFRYDFCCVFCMLTTTSVDFRILVT